MSLEIFLKLRNCHAEPCILNIKFILIVINYLYCEESVANEAIKVR